MSKQNALTVNVIPANGTDAATLHPSPAGEITGSSMNADELRLPNPLNRYPPFNTKSPESHSAISCIDPGAIDVTMA